MVPDSIRLRNPIYLMLLERLHESIDAKLNFSLAYYPQTDGQTERTNQILEDMLRACALKHGRNWKKFALCIILA
jgi:hypothetical protein